MKIKKNKKGQRIIQSLIKMTVIIIIIIIAVPFVIDFITAQMGNIVDKYRDKDTNYFSEGTTNYAVRDNEPTKIGDVTCVLELMGSESHLVGYYDSSSGYYMSLHCGWLPRLSFFDQQWWSRNVAKTIYDYDVNCVVSIDGVKNSQSIFFDNVYPDRYSQKVIKFTNVKEGTHQVDVNCVGKYYSDNLEQTIST